MTKKMSAVLTVLVAGLLASACGGNPSGPSGPSATPTPATVVLETVTFMGLPRQSNRAIPPVGMCSRYHTVAGPGVVEIRADWTASTNNMWLKAATTATPFVQGTPGSVCFLNSSPGNAWGIWIDSCGTVGSALGSEKPKVLSFPVPSGQFGFGACVYTDYTNASTESGTMEVSFTATASY